MPVIFFMPQPNGALINLSQLLDDITISTQVPGISSINLRSQKYLKQIWTLCDRWRIKLKSGKTHITNFSQKKVNKDTLTTMYGQTLSYPISKILDSLYW